MLSKFKIVRIKDVDTNKDTEKFKYRLGRECFIDVECIREGIPLAVVYNGGKFFVTTEVKYARESDFGLELKTKNRIYYFERL